MSTFKYEALMALRESLTSYRDDLLAAVEVVENQIKEIDNSLNKLMEEE